MTDILGGHGVDIDIVSGRPLNLSRASEEALQKAAEATHKRAKLLEALDENPILDILVSVYKDILKEKCAEDPRCALIEQVVKQMGYTIDLCPKLAEERLINCMGPTLGNKFKAMLGKMPPR